MGFWWHFEWWWGRNGSCTVIVQFWTRRATPQFVAGAYVLEWIRMINIGCLFRFPPSLSALFSATLILISENATSFPVCNQIAC